MRYYQNDATICLNGHTLSSFEAEYAPFCSRCGQPSISECGKCSSSIKGQYLTPGVVDLTSRYTPPPYCDQCGSPFPWTETLINNAVELVALDDNLDDEVKEILKNALPDLIFETPSTPVATAKYKKYIPSATKYIQDELRNLLVDVVSEAIKKALWG